MTRHQFFLVLLALLVLASPALAVDKGTVTFEDVGSYSYETDDDHVVCEVIVAELPFGVNQSHVFYIDGAEWDVEIGSWTEWAGAQKHVQATFTYPNGTIITVSESAWSVFGSYQTTIQPVSVQSESAAFFKINIKIGLDPAVVTMGIPMSPWSAQDTIAFDDVSGSFSDDATSNVYVYWMSIEDFENLIAHYNPLGWAAGFVEDLFDWTWEMIIAFLGGVPVIGPIMVSMITFLGWILEFGIYWVIFIIVNFPAILLSVEALIMLIAVINSKSFGKLWNNLFNYNVRFVEGILGIIMFVYNGAKTVIELVTGIINAIKPM